MQTEEKRCPKVSVVMPCYNDGRYLEEAIRSAQTQTYPNVEIIVVDDGSTDEQTLQTLRSVSQLEGITILHSQHAGPSGARNHGIAHSDAEYILPLDSDDTIEPEYIASAVEAIQSDPNIGIVYCHADLFGAQSGPWNLPDYSFSQMLRDNVIFVTALFRRNDWEAVGGFKTNMRHGMEDYDFWIGILELGRTVVQLPEVYFHYRIKESSRTTQLKKSVDDVKEMYRTIYRNHPAFYEKYRDEYATALRDALIEQIYNRPNIDRFYNLYVKLRKFPLTGWLVRLVCKK